MTYKYETLLGFELCSWPVLQFFRDIAEYLFGFDSCNFFVKLLRTCLVLIFALWPVLQFFREIAENLFGFVLRTLACCNYFVKLL